MVTHSDFVVHVPQREFFTVCPYLGNWTYLGNMPEGRAWLAAAGPSQPSNAPFFYVVGGRNITSGTDEILSTVGTMEPATGAWASLPSMPVERMAHAAVCVGEKLYALGGASYSPHGGGHLNTVDEYDPNGHTWSAKAPMPTGRASFAAVELDGKIYVVGGAAPNQTLATLEVYDPVSDRWDTLRPMPNGRFDLGAATIDGLLYVVGGRGPGKGLKGQTLEAYDPTTDTWETRRPMPTGRYELAATVLDNKLYAMGGEGTAQFYPANQPGYAFLQLLADVEVYDPISDSWCIAPHMRTPRKAFAAVTLTEEVLVPGSPTNVPFVPPAGGPGLPYVVPGVPLRGGGQDASNALGFSVHGPTPLPVQRIYAIGGAVFHQDWEYTASIDVYPTLPVAAYKSSERSTGVRRNRRTAGRRSA
ncbi:MAG: hypothetical protein HY683_09825 [Chloroflexi bacterium]|nr:hypothetical protein [Chloroflexota bacterium]